MILKALFHIFKTNEFSPKNFQITKKAYFLFNKRVFFLKEFFEYIAFMF